MPARLDHVTLGAPDPCVPIRFYDAALAALGLIRLDELVDEEEDAAPIEAAAWGPPGDRAFFWVVTAAVATSGLHLRVACEHVAQVERFYLAALEHGGRAHAAPRRWTVYRRGEFGATVIDPLGNLIEAIAPE